uniref:Uncharacterized protein n=1 Tax=Romanomermis culicivorax TaxID=13658 RepID=A0A915K9R6_ROMCU
MFNQFQDNVLMAEVDESLQEETRPLLAKNRHLQRPLLAKNRHLMCEKMPEPIIYLFTPAR